jgi:hypothetical protein
MNRQELIDSTFDKIRKLPDTKIEEISDFADLLLMKLDDKITNEGLQKLVSDSKTFDFLKDDDNLYSVNDLKEKYK